jgi:hypothetical protein
MVHKNWKRPIKLMKLNTIFATLIITTGHLLDSSSALSALLFKFSMVWKARNWQPGCKFILLGSKTKPLLNWLSHALFFTGIKPILIIYVLIDYN